MPQVPSNPSHSWCLVPLQAIQSRDGVQLQYSQSLVEKDQYRKRVRTLEEERDKLLSKLSKLEGLNSSLEAQVQRYQGTRDMGKKVCDKEPSRSESKNHSHGKTGLRRTPNPTLSGPFQTCLSNLSLQTSSDGDPNLFR